MADQVRWFDPVGQCRCGKVATGVLRARDNGSFGPYCRPCADKRLKAAEQERARESGVLVVGGKHGRR